MLIFSRKRDESAVVESEDGSIRGTVKVIEIRGDKVRLGFTFDRSVRVDREEIYELKQLETAKGARPEHAA